MSNHRLNKLPPQVILWGGTGQAKTVRPMIEHAGAKVVAVFDDTPGLKPPFPDVELYCGWESFKRWHAEQTQGQIGFCIAIGNPHGRVRLKLHDALVNEGLEPTTIVHPLAWVADDAKIGDGSQILAGAIVAAEAVIGRQCIIGTKGLVEHEAHLADAVEVAPSATVLGLTTVGVNSFVGAGATVLSRLTIGSDVTIAAGAVVSTDVGDNETILCGVNKRPL